MNHVIQSDEKSCKRSSQNWIYGKNISNSEVKKNMNWTKTGSFLETQNPAAFRPVKRSSEDIKKLVFHKNKMIERPVL